MAIQTNDLGIIDGWHIYEVVDTKTGQVIGTNKTLMEEENN